MLAAKKVAYLNPPNLPLGSTLNEYRKALSHIAMARVLNHCVALDQFPDAVIERICRLESRRLDLRVGDDVIALIGVLADWRLQKQEIGEVPLDGLAQLLGLGISVSVRRGRSPANRWSVEI